MKDMSRVQKKKVAVVQCAGGCRRQTENRGLEGNNCQQILETKADVASCEYGCLGGGSCVGACRLHAINISTKDETEVEPEK